MPRLVPSPKLGLIDVLHPSRRSRSNAAVALQEIRRLRLETPDIVAVPTARHEAEVDRSPRKNQWTPYRSAR